MSSTLSSLWGIVLAGGEGVRLKAFVRERVGADIPKQFCAFAGTRTMLERTVRRAQLLIPARYLVVSGTAHHRAHLFRCLGNRPPATILLQPMNRDTALGVLLPLIHILKQDPHALVVTLPSDHFVLPGRRLMRAVSQATDHLRRTHSDSLIVLAAEATYPETEYGWMAPGAPVISEGTASIFRVSAFSEKPSRRAAERMLADRWLWNTMVVVARGASLLELFRQAVPEVVACFDVLQRYVGSQYEQAFTDEVYRLMPSLNLSTAILAHRPDRLLVLPTDRMHWSDWGKKERIIQSLASLREVAHRSSAPANDLDLSAVAS